MKTPIISGALRAAAASITDAALRKLKRDALSEPYHRGSINNVDALHAWLGNVEKRLKDLYAETASRKLNFEMEAAPVRAVLYSELKKLNDGNCLITLGTMADVVGLSPTSTLFKRLIQGVCDGSSVRGLRERNLLWEEVRAAVNTGHSKAEVSKMLGIPEVWVTSIASTLGLGMSLKRNNRDAKQPSPAVQKRRRAVGRMLREGQSIASISKKLKVSVSTVAKDQRAVDGAVFQLAQEG
jgi:hypothetical protein